jgi:TPR repeat protein
MSQSGEGGKMGSKKGGAEGGLVCAHCKKVDGLGTMKCCSRCKRVHYCSVECQKSHWKIGGHKRVCGKEGGSGARGDGAAGASGGGEAPLQHPCPVCLDSEDDAGVSFAMCFSCGQMYCGKCNVMPRLGRLENCPTCRAVLHVSEQENVRRLRCLLERPYGRYTPVAQYHLGICYTKGRGADQDHTEAVRLFRLAASTGHVVANVSLGMCYTDGTGVDQDHAEAMRWYRLAADQGNARALCNLGICNYNGTGVAQDHAEAVRWFRLAADQGDARAQCNLGMCYVDGTGVEQDHAEAVRWFGPSADQGDATAQFHLGVCYHNGDGVDKDHTESVRLLHLAASQGSVPAQQTLSQLGF